MPYQLLLVEDDPIWRKMLTQFLNEESDLEVSYAASSRDEALTFCEKYKVDIVLMDIRLSNEDADGIRTTFELNQMQYPAKVIALTSSSEEQTIIDTFTAGAVQYIKKSEFRTIPSLIRLVMQTVEPQEVMLRDYLRLKEAEQLNHLTESEKVIVELYSEGVKRAQMAEQLGKSEGTLRNQITAILRKVGVVSMKEVVQLIKSRGLLRRDRGRSE